MNGVSMDDLPVELRLQYAQQVSSMAPEKVEALPSAKLRDLFFLSQKLVRWLVDEATTSIGEEHKMTLEERDRELAAKDREIDELKQVVGRLSRLDFKIRQKQKMIEALKGQGSPSHGGIPFSSNNNRAPDMPGAVSSGDEARRQFWEPLLPEEQSHRLPLPHQGPDKRASLPRINQGFDELEVVDVGVQAFLLESIFQAGDGREVPETDIQMVFDRVDRNRDGRISPQELDAELKFDHIRVTPEQLYQFFRTLDADGDGQITFAEFRDYVRQARLPLPTGQQNDGSVQQDPFRLNERVMARNRSGQFMEGQIQQIYDDGTYTVQFSSGERDGSIRRENIRKLQGINAAAVGPESDAEEYEDEEDDDDSDVPETIDGGADEYREAARWQPTPAEANPVPRLGLEGHRLGQGLGMGMGMAGGLGLDQAVGTAQPSFMTNAHEQLQVGMKVEVQPRRSDEFLPAWIVGVHSGSDQGVGGGRGGAVDVQFEDGSRDSRVPFARVRMSGVEAMGASVPVAPAPAPPETAAVDASMSGRPTTVQQAEARLQQHQYQQHQHQMKSSPVLQHQRAATVYNEYWDVHAQIQTAALIVQKSWRGHRARRLFFMTLERLVHTELEQSVVLRLRLVGVGCATGWHVKKGLRSDVSRPAKLEEVLTQALGLTDGSVRVVDVRQLSREEGVRVDFDAAYDEGAASAEDAAGAEAIIRRAESQQLSEDVGAALSSSPLFAGSRLSAPRLEVAAKSGNVLKRR